MKNALSRREFVAGTLAATGLLLADCDPLAALASEQAGSDIPLVDYHIHRDGMTLEKLIEVSKKKGVKFGIVEHAGTRENKYPIILRNDDELGAYIDSLEGKPVLKGVQAEWVDWMTCFSKETVAKLDYVLTDAMTFREKDGRRVKLWEKGVTVDNEQDFMDRYVDFHLEVMGTEPIDILANPTYLPPCIEKNYDALWTPKRMQKVIDSAVKNRVAIEISSSYRLPKLPFLKLAKEAGSKFSFGSNIRGPEAGKKDYWLEMIQALGLTRNDIFTPAPKGQKPIERRKTTA